MSNADLNRRDFLQKATTATVAVATGVVLYQTAGSANAATRADANKRWGLLIDTNNCDAGCDACVGACKDENGWEGSGNPTTDPNWIRKVNLKDKRTGATKSLPVMCQHCENPPCVDVCPTTASFKRPDGIVLVDRHACIGCRYCIMACPYGARSFVHEPTKNQKPHMPRGMGTVEACTLCTHRIDEGRLPACVEACSTKGNAVMTFGDLNDKNSDISKQLAKHVTQRLRDDLGLEPGVLYGGL